MKLLNEILAEIKPSIEQEKSVKVSINEFLDTLNSSLKDAKAILGGSGAKGTWLADMHDADIFVCFDYKKYKNKSSELSEILEKHLSKKFTGIIKLHGSRDYFQIKKNGFTFEIVPILKILKAKDAVNITDVSPLHAKWVLKHKKVADEIRLSKQFCKANNVYGAESYINGLSGYICEILTIRYGSFLSLARNASKWGKDKVIVDTEKYYKSKVEVLMGINKSKQTGPMIAIDPVSKERNAAAALSEEKYLRFIEACKRFLAKPSKDFFTIKKITAEDVISGAGVNKAIILDAYATEGKEDVVGVKLLKAYEFIRDSLIKNSFDVLHCGWAWDKGEKALFYYVIDPKELSEEVERDGPLLKDKSHVEAFKKKHNKTFVKDKKIFAMDKRKYRRSEELINDIINEPYLADKSKIKKHF